MAELFRRFYLEFFKGLLNAKTSSPIEIEVRFQNTTFKEFTRAREYLLATYGKPDSVVHSQDLKTNGLRKSIIQNPDGSTTIEVIRKTDLPYKIDKLIGFKISASSETVLDESEFKETTTVDLLRDKHRESWSVPSKNVRFDLTRVTQQSEDGKIRESFEVEIELINTILEIKGNGIKPEEMAGFEKGFLSLGEQTVIIKNRLQDTDIVYFIEQQNALADFINKAVKIDQYRGPRDRPLQPGEIGSFGTKARNLKYSDMVYGGLLAKQPKVTYSVTIKADGVRKFLVIHSTGLWLVHNPTEFCKISSFENLPPSWKDCVNTILDGEDIPVDKRKAYANAKHYYLPFDTLVFKGRDVTNEPLEKRIKYASTIRSLGVLSTASKIALIMEEKPFYFFSDTPEQFYKSIEKIEKIETNYVQDGYMLTPNNAVYNPQTEKQFKIQKKKRTLSNFPDICKWKPFEELTIDLAYYSLGDKRFLSAGNARREFTGSEFNPFDNEKQVDWFSPLFMDKPNGTIIEFAPKKIGDSIILTPKRVRFDKQYPNSEETAADVWDSIRDPIGLDTMKGESFNLVRKSHNAIKRKLFMENIEEGAHLIDIGSGRGADIEKMRKFSKVLCIEPDSVFLEEFVKRLNTSKEKDKFTILQAGGEETEKIVSKTIDVFGDEFGTKPVYVSIMLSLSFFWRDKDMLRSLIETLNGIKELARLNNPDTPVTFLFLTIEKTRTLKLLSKYNNSITFKDFFVMKYNEDKEEVYLDMPGTMVRNWTEYLVDLDGLAELLDAKVEYIRETNEQKFLNSYEKEYTSMYVYGRFTL